MKMEVLSVQNQFQGQFGVIGSTKVKDWTSPLTSPPPPPHNHRKYPPSHFQHNNSNSNINSNTNSNTHSTNDNVDVVDGPAHARQPPRHHDQHNQQNHHPSSIYNSTNHRYKPGMDTVTAAYEATDRSRSLPRYTYNNNLLYCGEHPAEVTAAAFNEDCFGSCADDNILAGAVHELSQRLQDELRAAKSRHLACTEVSLPWDLTPRIAAEIIKSSEQEPCGVRGCSIYIEFEDEPNNTRRIASFKVDPNTVSTFELYLTLKHDRSGWTSLLPQFLKNLTRSRTILISPDFTLTKNKLYSGE